MIDFQITFQANELMYGDYSQGASIEKNSVRLLVPLTEKIPFVSIRNGITEFYTLIGQDRDQYHIYLVRLSDIGRGEAESQYHLT